MSCTATLEPSTDAATNKSGLRYLPEAAKTRATDRKANKFEKTKVEKCGSTAWTEVYELAALIREGKSTWEDLNLDDVDVRLKWAGLFHRRKQTPGRFMMRLKVSCAAWSACSHRSCCRCAGNRFNIARTGHTTILYQYCRGSFSQPGH